MDGRDNDPAMTNREQTSEAIWAVSDGRAGLDNQVLGLAEAVARLSPRPIEHKIITRDDALGALLRRLSGPQAVLAHAKLAPPWPKLLIGCGRMSIDASIAVKRASGGATFTVQTQDPRTAPGEFDLVVPPLHDELVGANVFPIIGSPNRLTPAKLAEAAQQFAPRYASLPHPRIAILIGGDAKRLKLTDEAMHSITDVLLKLSSEGAGLMITTSRRTGEANTQKLCAALAGKPADIWDGTGDNPYLGILALADYILVTEDSVNMTTDAAATGKPIFTLKLSGHDPKFARFHEELRARGIARVFDGKLEAPLMSRCMKPTKPHSKSAAARNCRSLNSRQA